MDVLLVLIGFLLHTNAVIYDDIHNYDAYGTRIASNDHFVVLAQNDAKRFMVSMAPFGLGLTCYYAYEMNNYFVINVAVGRNQNSSQLFFVYLRTNSTTGSVQTLGSFRFSRTNSTINGVQRETCNSFLSTNLGSQNVKEWTESPSEMSTLEVDPSGKYAYGFLSKRIFIYDIERDSVQDLNWNDILPSIYFEPHALDISRIDQGISMAILAGYYEFDIQKALPVVYLIRLNSPSNMTIIDNYTIISSNQKFVRGFHTATYQFNYVMSVAIHDSIKQVLVAVAQLEQTFLLSFNETKLNSLKIFNRSARAAVWLDDNGIQAGLLLSSKSTLPWAQSRVEVLSISMDKVLYAYPNNQQILVPWTNTLPFFIRLKTTVLYQLVILTNDGVVVLLPWTDAGYYTQSNDIIEAKSSPNVCLPGTYKSIGGPTPCLVCPSNTKSSSSFISSNVTLLNQTQIPTINCTPCLSDSFCPLASIIDLNQSTLTSTSQAYAYPISPATTIFGEILMQNTFLMQATPRHCLHVSPFFWSLIVLAIAAVILIIMAILYFSSKGAKYFHCLACFFRHTDLIRGGKLWFGGLVSFSAITLIIYSFSFGHLFFLEYPIETSNDANFACDTSLRNAKFSSTLQLLATIKTNDHQLIFDMVDSQPFYMIVHFLQTGFTCQDLVSQENIGTYAVNYVYQSCIKYSNNATLTVTYRVLSHQITLQLNLTGSYYIGGLLICLNADKIVNVDSTYVVQDLKHCDSFYSSNQTIGYVTKLSYIMTKVINRTEYLDHSNMVNYSGIWIPTPVPGSLNDYLDYQQRGEFHRYLSTEHNLIVSFSESHYYVANRQEPIARKGEILFHNVLFTTTVIGLFGLAFLLFKLTISPILQWLIRRNECLGRYFNKASEYKRQTGMNESF